MLEKNKYKIILIIFLIAGIISVCIYYSVKKDKLYLLALGDELCKGITPFGTYKESYNDYLVRYLDNKNQLKIYNPYYCEENKKISTLIKEIKDNKKIKLKKKTLGLTSSIAKANIITISINNAEVLRKSEYDSIYQLLEKKYKETEELIKLIEKLTSADIYLISYYIPIDDSNKRNKADEYIYNKFSELEKYNNVHYIYINKGIMEKEYYIPNKDFPYPSLEGYNYINNEILKEIKLKY